MHVIGDETMTVRVVVTVTDGMTEIYVDGDDIDVLTLDYDVDGLAVEDFLYDADGKPCVIRHEMAHDPSLVETTFEHFKAAG